jgi:hypothetical protein
MELVGHKTESVYQRYDIVAERDLTDSVRNTWAHSQANTEENVTLGEGGNGSVGQIFRLVAPGLSTVFDAIVGYVSAILLHKRDKRELQKGADRALMAEMFTNADRVLSASGTHQPQHLSDTVWVSEIAVVSGFLSWEDLTPFVDAYDAASRFSDDIRDPKFLQALEKDNPVAHRMCLDFAEGILRAIEVLRHQRSLLTAAELSDVDDRLKKIRERAGKIKEFLNFSASWNGDHSRKTWGFSGNDQPIPNPGVARSSRAGGAS